MYKQSDPIPDPNILHSTTDSHLPIAGRFAGNAGQFGLSDIAVGYFFSPVSKS